MGVIGVREVSYDVMRCDIIGRGGSSEELSVNGLRSMEGDFSWISVTPDSRELLELLRKRVCLARA